MKYQPGLIKRMGEYVPAWKRTVKMPLTMRWVVLQNWPEIVRVLWSLRVWERRELARITLWSVARYKWSQKKISKMRDARVEKRKPKEAV